MAKVSHVILALLSLTLPLLPVTFAQTPPLPYLQITQDKAYYYPGDAGKLIIDIKNTLDTNILIYNLSVSFPWVAYLNGQWDGNKTIYVNKQVASGSWLPTITIGFTMPTDSRYFGGYNCIRFQNYVSCSTGQGVVNVWISNLGPGGSAGTFSGTFYVQNAYNAGIFIDWHYIFLLMIVMTALLGVIAGSVIFYVYTGFRRRQVLHWGSR